MSTNTTQLTYLTNSEEHILTATLLNIVLRDNKWLFQTDRTPFFVKGGGQQSDEGWVKVNNHIYEISQVISDADGTIWHVLKSECASAPQINSVLELIVNPEVRFRHSAIHTAGEVICAAMRILGYSWDVTSAIHYTDNSSIEYAKDLSAEEREQLKNILQAKVRELINQGEDVQIQTLFDRDEVIAACGYFPEYVKDKNGIRVVKVSRQTYGRPCKGTHLQNIKLFSDIVIRKIKNTKGALQIKYETII